MSSKICSPKIIKENASNIVLIPLESKPTYESSNFSEEKSIKNKKRKVTFNGVEIIDVESYKIYNQEGNLTLESLEKNGLNECKVCNYCKIF